MNAVVVLGSPGTRSVREAVARAFRAAAVCGQQGAPSCGRPETSSWVDGVFRARAAVVVAQVTRPGLGVPAGLSLLGWLGLPTAVLLPRRSRRSEFDWSETRVQATLRNFGLGPTWVFPVRPAPESDRLHPDGYTGPRLVTDWCASVSMASVEPAKDGPNPVSVQWIGPQPLTPGQTLLAHGLSGSADVRVRRILGRLDWDRGTAERAPVVQSREVGRIELEGLCRGWRPASGEPIHLASPATGTLLGLARIG
ncbi:MAG TPA: hypothetical protein RMG48_17080 [Myxococcales bacterium LLY-WYZ-16_1]|nr:hypothetical protein [Myxococcales bacterium LLY-WYZ-16_1]